jgi:hypothetical protein
LPVGSLARDADFRTRLDLFAEDMAGDGLVIDDQGPKTSRERTRIFQELPT